jgi:ubiquinone biosynthesis UbiH/UbiF/VisC/COQ6 family hydroxylase
MSATPAMQSDVDVAVVGTGVAGLATALGAAQLGLKVALVGPDARAFAPGESVPFDARIYALAPSAVNLLERLKVWPQMDAARVQMVARMRVFGDAGDELTFDAYQAALERLATIVEESELARVLAAACSYAPGIARTRAAFDRLQRDADGLQHDADGVSIALDDGSVVAARLVVGADGARSAVRAAAGINAAETPYGQTALVANLACARPHQGVAFQWFCDEGIVALLPLPGDLVSLVWSAPEALAAQLQALDAAAFAQRVTARTQSILGELTLRGGVHAFALRLIRVDPLVGERIALVGDAAHVVHPLAGQGLNLGLRDVSELLRVLAAREAFRDPGDAVLLRRYARARAEPVGLMRLTTDGLARLFGADDPRVRRLRNTGLALVDKLAPLKNALIRHAATR